MPVLLVGTLDTKGAEFAFVRDRLRAAGLATLVIDAGDVLMMDSVVDISGVNRISRVVLATAADAMIGMVKGRSEPVASARGSAEPLADATGSEKPIVTATMFGVTTPCVEASRRLL